MTRAEKFLSRLSSIDEVIKRRLEQIEELRLALLPSGISYDGIHVQTSPEDRFAGEMADIVDKYNKLLSDVAKDQEKKREVMAVVERLEPIEQKIVFYRFVDGLTWDETGENTGLSTRHAQRKYKALLIKVETMIGGENENNT